ncbi:MAG: phosphotransferase, partial [Gemmatimonadaceae bacterium]
MLSLEAPRVPALDVNTARRLLHAHFGVAGALEPLPSERDQNFRVTGADGVARVFKIASSDEQAQTFDMQAALLRHVESVDPTLPVPRVQSALSGSDTVTVEQAGQKLQLRLVSHVAGAPLASMPRTHEQLHQVGRAVGRLSRALRSFGHAGAHRELDWDLRRALASRGRLHNIADTTTRRLVETALDGFEQRVAPAIPTLRHSVVHGDPNDWNVLVDPVAPDGVTGIIDVGDALFSITIADLAIACAYGMLGTSSPVLAAAETIRGFHAEQPVHEHEIELLPDLIRGRLCTSLTMAAARRSRSGEANTYWFVSEQPAWALLEQLAAVNRQHAVGLFRRACGLEASPGARRISTWIGENADRFAPVVGRPLSQYETRRLDWANPNDPVVAATSNHDLCGADRAYDAQRKEHGFEIGIGAWGEARAIYTAPVFESKVISGGRRNVHLGLDIFTDAGVELHSPLPGRVVATANCERPQDYGGVLLLEHRTGDGLAFRTLWGHLEPESLQSLRPGQAVAAGDTVALLGSRDVNGGWVPHLHLQIVCTGEDDPAEIIGVGEPELLDLWTELYPDPTRLAGLHPEALTNADGTGAALAQRRRGLLGANLSLSYRRPLHIVRGTDVWLIDAAGRAYLD